MNAFCAVRLCLYVASHTCDGWTSSQQVPQGLSIYSRFARSGYLLGGRSSRKLVLNKAWVWAGAPAARGCGMTNGV